MNNFLIKLNCRHGEYEFTVTSLIQSEEDIFKAADEWARTFYDTSEYNEETFEFTHKGGEKYDWADEDCWFFNGGEVRTKVESVYEVSEEHVAILNKYGF